MKDANELRKLINNGETHTLEFKVKFEADKVGQALCALANDWPQTGEGILLIGVDDKTKAIVGFPEDQDKLQQDIANLCRTGIVAQIAPIVYKMILDRPIIVVEMLNCNEKPYRYKNNCYIRIGTTTRQASFEEETELKRRVGSAQENSSFNILSINRYKCDVPPVNVRWVGRIKELNSVSIPGFKVVFITGIGGQGKSGLASQYVTKTIQSGIDFEYWDWRDLFEEENRLHGKLISVIERLTKGERLARQLEDQRIESLVDIFFENLGPRKIVFVFDNIDRYIDLQTFLPSKGMDIFVKTALHREHNSKFIFTCRPFVKLAAVGFYQLNLGGLEFSDAVELFNSYKIPIKEEEKEDLIKESYQLTNGHPLWLNLIAAQSVRGKENAYNFINGIKFNRALEGEFSALTEDILKTVWDTLNQSQRILLRAMSEAIRAEREEILERVVSDELNANRFNKALRMLKSLNLVVVKSMSNEPDLLELHPLVKSFVKQKYTLIERNKFISMLVNYYNARILILKPKLKDISDLNTFEYWIDKIELDINRGNFVEALNSLSEISSPILTSGYIEQYLRICQILFSNIEWQIAIEKEYLHFSEQLRMYVRTLIEFGKHEECDALLKKYEPLANGSEAAACCNLRCYDYWYRQDFDSAIKWGQRYWDMVKISEPNFLNPPYDLLLAWRDSQVNINVEQALQGFLKTEKLEDVIKVGSVKSELGSIFYGNIGRCLWYLKKYDEALICYKKSVQILSSEREVTTMLNKGYAYFWIGEVLTAKGDNENASLFYQGAIKKWKQISPPRAKMAEERQALLLKQFSTLNNPSQIDGWEIDRFCNNYCLQA